MANSSRGTIRALSFAGALIGMFSFVFMAHLAIKWPTEPTWAPFSQIWENYVIAMTVFIKSSFPLLLALAVLLVVGLLGGWVGNRVGKWLLRLF